ncbi:MAG: acyl-CoA dehydrogenase family protein [Cyanobacteria bacterium P01_A01_bin.17]
MLQDIAVNPDSSVDSKPVGSSTSTYPADLLAPVDAMAAGRSETIATIQSVVERDLNPKVQAIDLDGEYPGSIMHQLGAAGAFQQAVAPEFGGAGINLTGAIQSIEEVSKACLSTGFIAWCQVACTWYLQNTHNQSLKADLLPKIARGEVLAGTGLSNPMKFFAGIEKIAIKASKVEGGYILNGQLPWVSNLGPGHYFGVVAQHATDDGYLMAIVSDEMEGVSLRRCGQFIALEGTGTFACVFRDAFVPENYLLADPCENYIEQIRPGFILTQVGMGLGLVAGCIQLMHRYQRRLGHVNCFLDDQPSDLEAELTAARQHAYGLGEELDQLDVPISKSLMREVVQARLTAGEMSVKAANAAMLHAGARAYIHGSPEERRLREAYFVAIVTPAIKQLKKMLYALTEEG